VALKLNLGCGYSRYPGWTGVDISPDAEPQVLSDVRSLPFEDESADEVYASHVLEHFSYDEPVLEEWWRVLKPGGRITVIVPDLVGVYYAWHSAFTYGMSEHRPIDLAYVNAVVFGAQTLEDGPCEMTYEHKQVFIFDMLVERMRPLFPDAQRISRLNVFPELFHPYQLYPGETAAQGHKP
jgi:SAM-dependent methyltransferase